MLAPFDSAGRFSGSAHIIGATLQKFSPAAMASIFDEPPAPQLHVADGVATIQIHGITSKGDRRFGSCYPDLCDLCLEACERDDVRAVLLHIDSPGGGLHGAGEAVRYVADLAKAKNVVAYCEDQAAGVAYWLASQARKVYANRSALVGDLGVFDVAIDSSQAATKAGVKVHVVRAGDHKGSRTPGVEITDATLAESQKLVDAFADFMVIDVARGRRISAKRAKAMADGRSHVGASAKALRFIDAVRSLDDVLAELSGKAAPAGTKATATTRSTPTVRAAVDEDDQEFDEDEFDDELDEQDDEDEDEIAMTTATVGNPEQRFKELVNAKVAAGMTRQAATSAVVKANPALHEAYVAAANARIKSRR